ncbi:hypothetical protein [Cellvibrio sp. KY-YJ-3]|uniref:hypothetical protein n=1 Tax=Cellvibrio sp. KY-YJ-3 TaxID=454662 RepID=UPI00124548D7|nr:hypothetical protein [Cellvibrio sp. KY-YJ-3]QEY12891.1 hypothetical protein D0B88_11880 [Cellvibrio sp. KY-YJ-3]
MKIDNVSALIKAHTPEGIKDFGFSFEFSDGLTILTGDNSSGKSTVLSCIYYCLGLEQLIGGKGGNSLSPALHQSFMWNGFTHQIYESRCSLVFTATNGHQYTATRNIKIDESTKFYEIEIWDGKSHFPKFIHSPRDHGDQGFFQWLAEVNKLELFSVEGIESESSKTLYMQNIFTLSFIEQTKGWSDFFSMMPSFGIKDPKLKVIEYCLGLNSLSVNVKLDRLKQEKNEIKREWSKIVGVLEERAQKLQLYFSDFDRKNPISQSYINKISIFSIDQSEKEISLKEYQDRLTLLFEDSEKKVESIGSSHIRSEYAFQLKDEIQEGLNRYIEEEREVSYGYEEELKKFNDYKEALANVVADMQGFQDIQKLTTNRTWEKITRAHCPVCDSSISNKRDELLTDEKIGKSMAFLRSQKNTYEKYIEASSKVIERYDAAIAFYKKSIRLKREQLDSVYSDISAPSFQAIRAEFDVQSELRHKLSEIDSFIEAFDSSKEKMKLYSVQFDLAAKEEKELKSNIESDEEKIKQFRKIFRDLIKDFGYRSNEVTAISISEDSNKGLLPTVFLDKEPQYIRFVSSASDFVRSIWAYYMALLIEGVRHPGFLIMDEPGQHQMRPDSMKELIKKSAGIGKQVILAISRSHNIRDEKVNISELLKGLPANSYELHDIDGGAEYVIKPLNSVETVSQ